MRACLAACTIATVAAFGVCVAAPARAQQEPTVDLPRLRSAPGEITESETVAKRLVRFLTSADYPPFQFVAPDGNPAGYNVDLARAICASLEFSCTIQALPWNELLPALENGRADALIAGLRPTEELRAKADLTRAYFRLPARFVAARKTEIKETTPESLAGKRIAVVTGTAHEAFLRAFFANADILSFPDADLARGALKDGRAELLFGDGAALALWLGGTASTECCAFVGEPFTESRFFGEGLTIAVRKGDQRLRRQIDRALDEIEAESGLDDLYLRWFPLGIF